MAGINITKAYYEGGNLVLKADTSARRFVYHFKPGEYEIVKAKKKRSLDANALAWKIIVDIASTVSEDKEKIYLDAIKAVGSFEQLKMPTEAVDNFTRIWSAKGLGWVVEVIDERGGTALCHAHYGSSVFTTSQMSMFIDYLIQDAKSLGIEVMSERERSLLLEAWDDGAN